MGLTIDELAREAGMTARNVRAYQTRGLLPPPVLHGRTGFYGPEHLERLRTIRRMQDEGLNLSAIGYLLRTSDPLRRAVVEPFARERAETMGVSELASMLGETMSGDVVRRAIRLAITEPVDDDTVRLLLPTVVRRAAELAGIGVPLDAQIEAVEDVDEHVRGVAASYVKLAREYLLKQLGGGEIDADNVRQAVEELRRIAADVLLSMFHRAMSEEIERAIAEVERGEGPEAYWSPGRRLDGSDRPE